MNYEEFLEKVVEAVKKLAGKEAEVVIHTVTKNNGIKLDGLVIMRKEKRVSPTIYLNEYYGQYLVGKTVETIAGKVYEIYERNIRDIRLPENFFMEFESIKQKVAYKIVNYEQNKELLGLIPHRRWKDLAIIYYIVYDNIYMERAVVTIYNNHTDLWGVSEEELYSLAVVNTPRLYKAEIKPLNEVVYDMILKEEEEKNEIDDLLRHVKKMNDIFPMYVLTNHMKNCGAVCMLYENVLERFSDYIESDVFIIPSSIHEVILVPMDGKVAFESLVEMVKSVNEEVAKEEILSDNVYVYLRNKGFR